ncbi:hypothetical protein [Thioclava electrotropha]|uniref:Uncharacterized protein n=1 Tax=Thioclava electrotropha TaxID=1549850 RepID=A0ABX6YTN7_9RHOB|nr:hypothetical protein [Thioclava electrotropha]QPZ91211.1 hypothetical protein AKL02_010060 [Thioclava electrotropha]
MQTYYQMPLDELCSLLIGMTRSFIEHFPANEVAADAIERGSLRRTLEAMRARAGLSRRDDTDIELLSSVLDRERGCEVLGSFMVFDGHEDPDLGAIGEVREMVDLTDRGQAIDACVRSLRRIAHIRSICRARIDAEKFLLGQ